MSLAINRDLIAQVIIILAVSIGGWMMFVEPAMRELSRLEGEIAGAATSAPAISQATVEMAAARIGEIREWVGEVRRRNVEAADSTTLYGKIMKLAADHGVVVRQLQPNTDDRDGDEGPIEVSRLEMTLEGGFEQVATFIDEIDGIGGFLRPSSLQLAPMVRDDRQLVGARFVCESLRFTLGENLDQLGVAHVEP
ncbi:MAG: hypothetical protein ACYTJ0_06875 [Planctomycetota bacterium]|jgi:Tfp pilus assembly protein PilO